MKQEAQNNQDRIYQGCYGKKIKGSQVRDWLLRGIKENISRCENGTPRACFNIWSAPGVGKTSIVKSLTKETVLFNGKEENIEVVDIPLAQIEEMGDLLGFPVEEIQMQKGEETLWVKAVDSLIRLYVEKGYMPVDKRTTYAPPSWVPKTAKPGIILFDDGNRASQRIMRGMMQLVQDYRTISWSIPLGWTIVFTGNPDNRFNQVTSMDTAQLTRMKHVTLEVSAQEWCVWAASNGIDERGIAFVSTYPEMLIGKERTNPRSLTEFFRCLPNYPILTSRQQLQDCLIEAYASLDEETVSVLASFFQKEIQQLVSPEQILNGDPSAIEKMEECSNEKRNDAITTIFTRLLAYIASPDYRPEASHVQNFQKFVSLPFLPKDPVYAFLQQFSTVIKDRKWCCCPEIMRMILDTTKKD